MNKKFSKHINSIIAIICVISQLFLCTACFRSKYRFDQSRKNMESIEIVEANYDIDTDAGTQRVLLKIDDIDDFLNKIEDIKYKDSGFLGPRDVYYRSLAIKISYNNGDYELLGRDSKFSFYADSAVYKGRVVGTFDYEEFYALLFNYLNMVETCTYGYMHDTSNILSIEIVNSDIQDDNSLLCETLAVIEDEAKFIEQLNSVEYIYTNDYNYSERLNQKSAIKITYQNGDYEVFTYNHRDEVELLDTGTERAGFGTYIGTFDKTQFNALVNQYLSDEIIQ